jgi:hypothetical protein
MNASITYWRELLVANGLPSFSVVGLAGLGQAAQRRTLHR